MTIWVVEGSSTDLYYRTKEKAVSKIEELVSRSVSNRMEYVHYEFNNDGTRAWIWWKPNEVVYEGMDEKDVYYDKMNPDWEYVTHEREVQ